MSTPNAAIRAVEHATRPVTGGKSAVPLRVQSEINRREADAERLIGWVQLAIVLFFAALYAIAPRAEGGLGNSFVPMALASYFLFTVFRVALSYRIILP